MFRRLSKIAVSIDKNKKSDDIRMLLLKTVGKSPDLFSYYVAIQEAKALLGQEKFNKIVDSKANKPVRILGDC